MGRLLLLLPCCGTLLGAGEGTLLTNCQQILKLSPTEANASHEVHFQGVVTCYIPAGQLCFVQDASGGVYVFPAPWPKELSPGDTVDVTGFTASGLYSPIIATGTIRKLGKGNLPVPEKISLEQLNSGAFDSQWIEISGVVRKQEDRKDHILLEIWNGSSSGQILLFSSLTLPDFTDSRITIRGVGGTFYNQQKLTGFGLFAQDPVQIVTSETANDPFALPIHSIAKLLWYTLSGSLDNRVHLKGTALFSPATNQFLIKDETGALMVEFEHKESVVSGDEIEVSGFIRNPTGNRRMEHALVRKTGRHSAAQPSPVTLKQLRSGDWSNQWLITRGTVVASGSTANGATELALTDDDQMVMVQFDQSFPKELRGSRVEIAGVLSKLTNYPMLLAGSSTNLTVLSPPLASSHKTSALPVSPLWFSLLLGLPLIPLGWALVYKKRAETAKIEQGRLKKELEQSKFEFEHLSESRERLGRDLHDHIIQSIYAVGLNVEDCTQLLAREPLKVEGRLKSAMLDINSVIRELRNVILGLESNAIQPQEFRTALKSLALTLGQENSNKIRLDLDQPAMEALSSGQATELIHIAREAMSNSLRHGAASKTTISMRLVEGQIRFCVEDDGKGFNPSEVTSKGFGLRNMSKRSHDLGANFSIFSEYGKGTRIVLDIPIQKQHFSPRESHSRFNS